MPADSVARVKRPPPSLTQNRRPVAGDEEVEVAVVVGVPIARPRVARLREAGLSRRLPEGTRPARVAPEEAVRDLGPTRRRRAHLHEVEHAVAVAVEEPDAALHDPRQEVRPVRPVRVRDRQAELAGDVHEERLASRLPLLPAALDEQGGEEQRRRRHESAHPTAVHHRVPLGIRAWLRRTAFRRTDGGGSAPLSLPPGRHRYCPRACWALHPCSRHPPSERRAGWGDLDDCESRSAGPFPRSTAKKVEDRTASASGPR
jgi:hypothetical protein